ncbi:LOW QUALITY PROTEIN: sodium/sulphate symporter [Geomicrobium sp. JCM 19039]|nr:LOW QUALITY PROTEIN: sodium/sulphate symporter [Geomicrobium sp. JCM 19039]
MNETTNPPSSSYSKRNRIGLFLGPALFLLTYFLIPDSIMGHEPRVVLAVTMLVATFWITEAIPMAAASLVPIVLIPVLQGAEMGTIASAYANPVIFMYAGGFVIAIAIEKWNLHRRIALGIIGMIGSQSQRIILGIIISTAAISMFVSNAATALMMLPVAVALIKEVKDKQILSGDNLRSFSKSILLSVAYAATIGGLATIVAAVPNAVLAGIAYEQLGRTVTFVEWFMFAGPVALLMLVILYFYLTRIAFKITKNDEEGNTGNIDFIKEEKKKLGKFNYNEFMVSIAFGLTVLLWVTLPFIEDLDFIHTDPSLCLELCLLFFIPSNKKGERILEWQDMTRLPWGVLILFGGGMAIAAGFSSSGLNEHIGDLLGMLQGLEVFFIILLLVVIVLAITEILSNTAVANLVLPLTLGMGLALGIDPLPLMAAAALSAGSCYMLPVATPPNTAVFSAGYLEIGDMAKAGVWLNLASIVIITLAVYYWMPVVFGL